FFQAEDGIRDFHVTGVQTCALPISSAATQSPADILACTYNKHPTRKRRHNSTIHSSLPGRSRRWLHQILTGNALARLIPSKPARSEERRVGKECRSELADDS